MTRFRSCALAAALLAAGCATVPEETAGSGDGSAVEGEAQAAAASAAPTEFETIALGANDVDPTDVITCREILQPGSNVIRTRCMTQEAWEMYDRYRTMQAQEFLRALQNGTYRY